MGAQADGLQATVGSSDPAAVPQELGTARMPARPFLLPVAAGMGEEVARAVGAAVLAALRGDSPDAGGTRVDLCGDSPDGSNLPGGGAIAGGGTPTSTNPANTTGMDGVRPAARSASPNLFAGPGAPTNPSPINVGYVHTPELNLPSNVIDVGDNTSFHTFVINEVAQQIRNAGGIAIKEVQLYTISGKTGPRPDLLIKFPGSLPEFIDIKTGDNTRPTDLQGLYHPLIPVGGHLLSNDPRIVQFGFKPGEPLPPTYFAYITKRDANSPAQVDTWRPRY